MPPLPPRRVDIGRRRRTARPRSSRSPRGTRQASGPDPGIGVSDRPPRDRLTDGPRDSDVGSGRRRFIGVRVRPEHQAGVETALDAVGPAAPLSHLPSSPRPHPPRAFLVGRSGRGPLAAPAVAEGHQPSNAAHGEGGRLRDRQVTHVRRHQGAPEPLGPTPGVPRIEDARRTASSRSTSPTPATASTACSTANFTCRNPGRTTVTAATSRASPTTWSAGLSGRSPWSCMTAPWPTAYTSTGRRSTRGTSAPPPHGEVHARRPHPGTFPHPRSSVGARTPAFGCSLRAREMVKQL